MSGQCHKPDARTHNQIIVASRSILRQNGINSNMSDVNFTDTIINGNRLLATTLESKHGSTLPYVTVMSITDSISPKCGVFVRIDKGGYDSDWSVNFCLLYTSAMLTNAIFCVLLSTLYIPLIRSTGLSDPLSEGRSENMKYPEASF